MYPADPAKGLVVPNAAGPAAPASTSCTAARSRWRKNPKLEDHGARDCSAAPTRIATRPSKPPKNQPNLVICEEVRLNGAAEDYIAGNNFWNRGRPSR